MQKYHCLIDRTFRSKNILPGAIIDWPKGSFHPVSYDPALWPDIYVAPAVANLHISGPEATMESRRISAPRNMKEICFLTSVNMG